jgi:8-oxo-dGTP diphosphatase
MPRVHVAVGVIRNRRGEILISYRHPDLHQGALWEFPGGKVEHGESVRQALQRELEEELGIVISGCDALLEVAHDYADKAVLLDVWLVDDFAGEPRGREGQRLAWCPPERLQDYRFPAANTPIVEACLTLPARAAH